MLRHPKYRSMLEAVIDGIPADFEIFVFVRKDHVKTYTNGDLSRVVNLPKHSVEFVQLDATPSQVETARTAVEWALSNGISKNGAVIFRDCDSFWTIPQSVRSVNSPAVITANISEFKGVRADNKSYLFEGQLYEKDPRGKQICVGGYVFPSLPKLDPKAKSFSDLKQRWGGIAIQDFVDVGEAADWVSHCSSWRTIFCDLDGTLVKATSSKMGLGTGEPLLRNIEALQKIKNKAQIIITTGRMNEFREVTERELAEHNIPYDGLIMGLYHAPRILINDVSLNDVTRADAINIPRDLDGSLAHFLF